MREKPRANETIESVTPARRLEGKVAVVTGASRGIGLAIARTLAESGVQVVMVARGKQALEKAARRVGRGAIAAPADVSQPHDVESIFRRVARHPGRLDILINNAGVFTFKPFRATTLEDWRKNLDINLTALFLTTRSALPLLMKSGAPHIINILSTSSRHAFPKCSAYTAAKFGALGFTQVIHRELRSEGIRVTAILPGVTETRMLSEFDFAVNRNGILQPQDVADAVTSSLTAPSRATYEEILLMPSKGFV